MTAHKRWRMIGVAAVCGLLLTGLAAAAEPDDAWTPLFDGKTLQGWHQVGEGRWVVEDGAIVGKTQAAVEGYSLLISDEVFLDFTVRLAFKSLKGNSGFYVRMVLEEPDRAHGLQIEVDPRQNTGGIYESYGRAWVCQPAPEAVAEYYRLDEWNDMEIAAHGGDVTVKVNGVVAAGVKDDPSRPAGQFAMQMHAGNEMLVMFKDIRVRAVPRTEPDRTAPTQPETIRPGQRGELVLPARSCRISGSRLAYMPDWEALGFWRDGDQAAWEVDVPVAGTYDVTMEWSVGDKAAGNPYMLEAGGERLEGTVEPTGGWDVYRRKNIGRMQLDTGVQTIVLKPGGRFDTALMDLRELRLLPPRGRRR